MKKCIGICTDSATNKTEHRSGVVVKVKNVSHPDILSTHCIIQREHLLAPKKFLRTTQSIIRCY